MCSHRSLDFIQLDLECLDEDVGQVFAGPLDGCIALPSARLLLSLASVGGCHLFKWALLSLETPVGVRNGHLASVDGGNRHKQWTFYWYIMDV